MKRQISLSVLTISIAAFSLVLVGLGGYVRGTGAGLSCPDWPLCYGRAVPSDFGNGVFQEVVHRYIASAVSTLTIVFAFIAFRKRRELPRVWKACLIALVVLAMQVILGGLTVLMRLNPFIVTSHLALGTVFLQLFLFLAADRQTGLPSNVVPSGNSRKILALLCGLTFLQILVGGFVGSSGASLACPDLPNCFGEPFLPEGATHQQQIHMLHRAFGIFVFLGVCFAAVREFIRGERSPRLWLATASGIGFVQIALGVLNVYTRIKIHVAVTHLIVAEALLFSLLQAWHAKACFPIMSGDSIRTAMSGGVRMLRDARRHS